MYICNQNVRCNLPKFEKLSSVIESTINFFSYLSEYSMTFFSKKMANVSTSRPKNDIGVFTQGLSSANVTVLCPYASTDQKFEKLRLYNYGVTLIVSHL